jgi:Adenylate and Guanylate cyclase catalytic domain
MPYLADETCQYADPSLYADPSHYTEVDAVRPHLSLDGRKDAGGSQSSSSNDDSSRDEIETQDNDTAADSPEEIIRTDNHTVRLLRTILPILLVIAAVSTVTSVYRYMSRKENDQFLSEYESLSSMLLSSLLSDMRQNFWIAHTLSKSATLAMLMKNNPVTNFTIPPRLWDSVTKEARVVSESLVVSWIPFLYTDYERATFEQYIRSSPEHDNYEADISFPTCHVCDGDPNMMIEDESVDVEIHGLVFKCGAVFKSGFDGGIPSAGCPVVQKAVSETCTCSEQKSIGTTTQTGNGNKRTMSDGLSKFIGESNNYTLADQEYGEAPYAPMFTIASSELPQVPPLYNLFSDPIRSRALSNMTANRNPVISEMRTRNDPYHHYTGSILGGVSADLYFPVFSDVFNNSAVVGAIGIEFLWERLISDAVPAKSNLLALVLENTCGQVHTYTVNPEEGRMTLNATDDVHNRKYDGLVRTTSYADYEELVRFQGNATDGNSAECLFVFKVYPTLEFERMHVSLEPIAYALICGVVFLAVSVVFLSYDSVVRRRQSKVMASAKRTNDIVTSLFPDTVRGRMYERAANAEADPFSEANEVAEIRDASNHDAFATGNIFGSEPIADLFPHTTIMFLDIAGFTAWSSEREPSQVFSLLEHIYHSFDEAGRKLGIFKVETIGDCYVAAAGLPKPRNDHAVGKPGHTSMTFIRTVHRRESRI